MLPYKNNETSNNMIHVGTIRNNVHLQKAYSYEEKCMYKGNTIIFEAMTWSNLLYGCINILYDLESNFFSLLKVKDEN